MTSIDRIFQQEIEQLQEIQKMVQELSEKLQKYSETKFKVYSTRKYEEFSKK